MNKFKGRLRTIDVALLIRTETEKINGIFYIVQTLLNEIAMDGGF